MKRIALAIVTLLAVTAGSLSIVTAVSDEKASAAGLWTRSEGCDYDSYYNGAVYGSTAVSVSGAVNSCRYSVMRDQQVVCSYVRIPEIWVSGNVIRSGVTGTGWRVLTANTVTWPSGYCAGQVYSGTFVWGGDYKIVRSWAKDVYASPRTKLTVSAAGGYLENSAYFQNQGTWTFWT